MRLYPAIDLKDGKCVRLFKGDMDAATIYNDDAGAQAKAFEGAGFDYLHVVDLNGAVSGSLVNQPVVKKILSSVTIRAQVEAWLNAGMSRVILGTVAVKNPALVKEVARDFPGKIVVGIDARGGMVAVEGWVQASTMKAVDLARAFEDVGVAAIVYTDIARDGTLQGPNLDETAALAEAISIPVILSGGIANIGDLQATKARASSGIEGIIMGRALYEKTIIAADAIALMRSA